MTIKYNTRDGAGNDIEKDVVIKEFPLVNVTAQCGICRKDINVASKIKDIVSSSFTDWAMVGDYICPECSKLFSLYFYNYIIDPDGIHLYNVRQLREQLIARQKPPFMFCISTSQKKHLFYRAKWNYTSDVFSVNLETEQIYTSTERMKRLFDFVEALQTLGCGKEELSRGEIRYAVIEAIGFKPLLYLREELNTSREIRIPLYCGQKRDITKEDAICIINSILKA